MAHACNPSYSEGRDQEDHSLKPAQANSLWDGISKKIFTRKGWQRGSRCRSWVQTPVPQKKKRNLWNICVVCIHKKGVDSKTFIKEKLPDTKSWETVKPLFHSPTSPSPLTLYCPTPKDTLVCVHSAQHWVFLEKKGRFATFLSLMLRKYGS
jgi:hypothetical protein